MGTSIENIFLARSLAEVGLVPNDALVIDIGAQELKHKFDVARLHAMFREFLPAEALADISGDAFADARYTGAIFEFIGFRYTSIES